MAGKCRYEELRRWSGKLSGQRRDRDCRALTEELARRLRDRAAENTPVVTGTLRAGWTALPAERRGRVYRSVVKNTVDYASYVEYGHRQQAGRYVPALGRRLAADWVRGRWMLARAEEDFSAEAAAVLRQYAKRGLE